MIEHQHGKQNGCKIQETTNTSCHLHSDDSVRFNSKASDVSKEHKNEASSVPNLKCLLKKKNKTLLQEERNVSSLFSYSELQRGNIEPKVIKNRQTLNYKFQKHISSSNCMAMTPNQHHIFSVSQDNDKITNFAHKPCIGSRRTKCHKKHRLCRSFYSECSEEQEIDESIVNTNDKKLQVQSILTKFRSSTAISNNDIKSKSCHKMFEEINPAVDKNDRLRSVLSSKKKRKHKQEGCQLR